MTFEQWGSAGYGIEDFSHVEKSAIKRMYADWKAEREKLIGALGDCLGFIDELKDQGIRDWSKEENARAVLAEVKEQGNVSH